MVGSGCERLVMVVGGGGVVVCIRGLLLLYVAVHCLLLHVPCVFCEKRRGTGDLLLTVSINRRSLFVIVIDHPLLVIGGMAPGYRVNKGRGRGGAYLNSCGHSRQFASSLSR